MRLGACAAVALALAACSLGASGSSVGQPPAINDVDQALNAMRNAKNGRLSNDHELGTISTASTAGRFDTGNPFFRALGTNGRACVTCHTPAAGWSLSATVAQARFRATGGRDPLFDPSDGANSPELVASCLQTKADPYSLVLDKGLIRIEERLSADSGFVVAAVDDPDRYATASRLSLYRRPLPAANLRFEQAVMWDGRNTLPSGSLPDELGAQARDAALTHAGTPSLPDDVASAIVAFESSLVTAETQDKEAGALDTPEGQSTLDRLAKPPPSGASETGLDVFNGWLGEPQGSARQAIAQGEAIFNRRTFKLVDVAGFPGTDGHTAVNTTCRGCHTVLNAGASSGPLFMATGLADAAARTPDLPLYTLRKLATGETLRTTDPGRALVTGRWDDIGKFKVPGLRGLAARPPYFHNGSAATARPRISRMWSTSTRATRTCGSPLRKKRTS
ncbi:MAG TPA: hypothetical protein VK009_12500 [Chloroflexota bacterium]|nr:hypothetical protein [Chloroflexota bacterium]